MSIGLVNFDYNIHEKVRFILSKKVKISHFFGYVLPNPNSSFGNINYVSALNLYKINDFSTLYKKNIKFSSEEELVFYNIYDRVSNCSRELNYKKKFLQKISNYWFEFFQKNSELKMLIFSSVPHRPWDFALYLVAKKLSIKTVFICRSSVTNLVYLRKDFNRKKNNIINIKTKNNLLHKFLSNWTKYQKNLTEYNSSFTSNILLKKYIYSRSESRKIKILKKIIGEIAYLFLKSIKQILDSFYIKIPIQPKILSYNSYPSTIFAASKKKINRISFITYVVKYALRNFTLNYYNIKISKKEITNLLKKNFVFFPLHFQPERTTEPEGWKYSDQLSALRILSDTIPDDWIIIVKEHPRQLFSDLRNYHYRSLEFYENLNKIKRVFFVSSKSDYYKILKYCKFTATITGSVSYDGLLENKPGITFGSTWLDTHPCINLYKNKNDLKNFFRRFNSSKKKNFNHYLKKFFKNQKSFFYDGSSFDGWWEYYSNRRRSKMTNNTVDALIRAIKYY